jgi:small subunit ribosomal protein S2
MSEYIFGTRIKTDIIDLDKTVPLLRTALQFLAHVAFRKGIILFVTRHAQNIPIVERTAFEVEEYSNCKKWQSGLLTDSTRRFGSVVRLPDVVVFLNTHDSINELHPAIIESAKMIIPTVAICDTDTDPSLISYPIPGNDDSISSVNLYCNLFKQAILAGKQKRKELEANDYVFEF